MTRINTTDADMAEPNEIIEAPPGMMDAILKAIAELDIATHADIVGINQRLDTVYSRVETVETAIAELPAKYASTDSLNKITSSQAEHESRSRSLTEQVANLANVQADSQRAVTSIETKINELSSLKTQVNAMTREFTLMTGNLNTFMDNQRARLDTQQATITEAKTKTEALTKDVAFLTTDLEDAKRRYSDSFNPVRDYVLGSPTQEGLKTTIRRVSDDLHLLRTDVSHQTAEFALIANYVKGQQAREEATRNYWQRVRLQLYTPKGIIAVIFAIVFVLMVMNAFSLDQLFARLGEFFVLTGLLKH